MNEENIFRTKDKALCQILLCKFRAIETSRDDDGQLLYKFFLNDMADVVVTDPVTHDIVIEKKSVRDVISMILNGESNRLLIACSEFWNAEQTWLANLRFHHVPKSIKA